MTSKGRPPIVAALGVAGLAALGRLVGDDATVEDGYRAVGDVDDPAATITGRCCPTRPPGWHPGRRLVASRDRNR